MNQNPGLESPVSVLPGVGTRRAALLNAAGYFTLSDLIRHLPNRWEDRSRVCTVDTIEKHLGKAVGLTGTLTSAHMKTSPVRRLRIFEAVLDDGTGQITVVWFNQPWIREKLKRGDRITIYGQPTINSAMRLQIENPDWSSAIHDDAGLSVKTVYGSIAGMKPWIVSRLVAGAIEAVATEDSLPPEVLERLDVEPLIDSIVALHFPESLVDGKPQRYASARRRFVLEEFLAFQLSLLAKRREREASSVASVPTTGKTEELAEALPFELTHAQSRALEEIVDDLGLERPMYRLLQGDVGSGKTIVALLAAQAVVEAGFQVALLAPTGILAEQLHARAVDSTGSRGIECQLLTGSTSAVDRRGIIQDLRAGTIQILIGTHALLESDVEFARLGLAIVDEQHRFGVGQRRALFAKGATPNVLVMSATPIPRSLAIAAFADMDLSIIDELPKGRQPVRTVVRGKAKLPAIYEFAGKEIADGGQAFVVFPLVEESDKIEASAVLEEIEGLRALFPERRIDLLHGRMTGEEKESVMARFAAGESDLLATTTIVEVGLDVPNASVMIVNDADRLGLSQLHQLRGRVGRGSRKGWCILVRDERSSEPAKTRLRKLAETSDGFEVARIDLETRGFGEIFGTRQHGAPKFRFGDPIEDSGLMEEARGVAVNLLDDKGADYCRKLAERLLGPAMLRHTARD